MARKSDIRLRRSAVSGSVPSTTDLNLGELAINTYDGKLFLKKDVTGTETVVEVGGNKFGTIAVSGQSDIVADSTNDTLTFAAGSGMTITTDASTDTITLTSSGASSQSAVWKEYVYTATSGQTSFSGTDDNSNTLSYVTGYLQVFLNGVLLDNGTDYTATNGTSVVLVNGASASDLVQIATFVKVLGTGDAVTDTFTGDGNTSAYTLSTDPDVEDNTLVFVDGVYQEKDTYTVSGTTLTFDANVPNGASIEVVIGSRNVTVEDVQDLTIEGDLTVQGESFFTGDAEFTGDIIGQLRGPVKFSAQAGETLAKGDVVYISGVSGQTPIVSKADADDAAKMPAFGLAEAATTSGNPVDVITFGTFSGYDTDTPGWSLGDTLYVSTTAGQITNIVPSGESSLIQNIGKVQRVDASAGRIKVGGAGRSNAVPNLNDGNIFIGNASNRPVTSSLNTLIDSRLSSGNVATIETSGNVTIGGDLTVNGTTTTLNTATLDVEDINITLNYGAGDTSSTADGAGITIQDAVNSTTDATILWDQSNSEFDFSHDINITGGVTTSAASDFNSDLNISGTLSLDGTANELRFYEGANYVGFEAPALSGDQIWVLPDSDGTAGYALKTDGAGNLSWGLAGGNAFETIAVSGQSDVVAASSTDTLTLAAGTGIAITTNASTDTITITNNATGDNAFGNIAVSGQTTVAADSTNDTLTLVGQNGVAITTDASTDTVTIDGRTSYNTFTTDLFTTANNSTTDFVLSVTPSSEDNLIVFVEGVYQNKNSYSLTSNTLTLSGAPGSGEEVVVHIVSDVITGQSLVRNNFTGDNTTTDFTLTLAPMNANNTFVYFDGVYQEKSEYSVSGTTLSFNTAPALNDSIEVIIPKATELNSPSADSINSIDQFDDTAIIGSALTSTTLATTSQSTIATHAAATYRTIKYLVQCTQGTDYHSTEINLIHDGTTVYITEYGTLFDNAALGTFDATISSGNILLQMTPGSATSMTVKVMSSAIPV